VAEPSPDTGVVHPVDELVGRLRVDALHAFPPRLRERLGDARSDQDTGCHVVAFI
jgi:hypothetical protein